MKKLLFFSMLLFGMSFQIAAQDAIAIDTGETIVQVEQPNVEDLANAVLKQLTQDSTAVIQLPGTFDPSDPESIFEWWMFIFGLLMPIGLWLFHKFWPSSTKSQLILKSTSVAIIVLMIIVFSKGASILVIGQAVMAFIMKVMTYKNVVKPLARSPRAKDYDNSK